MGFPPESGETMTDTTEPKPTESADEQDHSRRGFLTRSALTGGALLTLGGGAGVALADEHTGGDGAGTGATFDDVEGTDVDVLNYALSLEHLESAFYQEAMDTFDEDEFLEADALEDYTEEDRQMVYGFVETVADHEAQHVEVLTQAVALLGGDPADPADYDFGFEDVAEFISLAQVLENTGVAAYAGAAPFVESPDLLGAALSIHSVEARHAAMMNAVAGSSPFPNAFDPASSQSEVLDAVSGFIAGEPETEEEDGEETDGDDETETPADEETPMGNETETPMGNETETPMGNETETPMGNETETPMGNETAGNGTAGNETTTTTDGS